MLRSILVLDKVGMPPSLVCALESELHCRVEVTRQGSYARSFLESSDVSLAVVNPYLEQGGLIESNIGFVRILRERDIPVIIHSRVKIETIAQRTGLSLGVDYQAYLRKPTQISELIKCASGLING